MEMYLTFRRRCNQRLLESSWFPLQRSLPLPPPPLASQFIPWNHSTSFFFFSPHFWFISVSSSRCCLSLSVPFNLIYLHAHFVSFPSFPSLLSLYPAPLPSASLSPPQHCSSRIDVWFHLRIMPLSSRYHHQGSLSDGSQKTFDNGKSCKAVNQSTRVLFVG